MFGVLTGITKAAIGVAITPVAVVADLVTLGGALQDRDEPYTATVVKSVAENIGNAIDPDK